jgi:hypothetical protein
MNMTQAGESAPRKPLRLWLGVFAIALWLLRFGIPSVLPEAILIGMLGALVGALALLVWWTFFSRVPWTDRLGAIVLMILAVFATSRLIDKSIATGMMGFMFLSYAIPVLSIAFAVWAIFSRRLADGRRPSCLRAERGRSCGPMA